MILDLKYHPNRFEFWLLHFENHDSELEPYLRKPQRIFQLKVVYLHLSLPMHYHIQLFLDGAIKAVLESERAGFFSFEIDGLPYLRVYKSL